MNTKNSVLSCDEQIQNLLEQGFVIADKAQLQEFLSKVNYYRFIGYATKFNSGTDITRVIGCYNFDTELKHLLFKTIGEIETFLRTKIAYYIGQTYPNNDYHDIYNISNPHAIKTLNKIKKEISQHSSKSLLSQDKNGRDEEFPIWLGVELVTFTSLSMLYSCLNTKDKKQLSKYFALKSYRPLESWLKAIAELRNFVAHYNRLYAKSFATLPLRSSNTKNSSYVFDRKLFSQLLILKYLLKGANLAHDSYCTELILLIEKYQDFIIFSHIGLPENWKILLQEK